MNPRSLLARLQFNRNNVAFRDLERLAVALGFRFARTAGSHRLCVHTAHPGLNCACSRREERPSPAGSSNSSTWSRNTF